MFYDKYLELCELKGESPSAVARKLDLSATAVTKWSRGAVPRQATIRKISAYFDVPADYLLLEEKEKPAANSDGLKEKMLSLSPDMLKLFVRFLALAEANPESAKRFLAFAVQELERGEQAK